MSSYIHFLNIENTMGIPGLKNYLSGPTMIWTFTVQKTKSHVLWAVQFVWRSKDFRDNWREMFFVWQFFADLIDGMIYIKLYEYNRGTRLSARSGSSYL